MSPLSFRILGRLSNILVVNKSPDIDFHDNQGEPGLCSLVKNELGVNVFPAHRLDKITSGVMLLPTTSQSAHLLSEQFSKHIVEKFYIALSDRKPAKKEGSVIGDMQRSRRGQWRLSKTKVNPAVSQFKSLSMMPGIRSFLVRPITGKTHEIRVALKSLGAPIFGDGLYAGERARGLDRTYLHAYAARFIWEGKTVSFICPPDQGDYFKRQEMQACLDEWNEPWSLKWPI